MKGIVGIAKLVASDGSVIRTQRFNNNQSAKVNRDKAGNESYNEEGAVDYLKRQRAAWQQSDQFVGETLSIVVE